MRAPFGFPGGVSLFAAFARLQIRKILNLDP
jgi:hypothetical protein